MKSWNEVRAEHQREIDAMLNARGITEQEWHREMEQAEEDIVIEDQKRGPNERIKDFDEERHINLDSALVKHIAATVRWYVEESVTVIEPHEYQLADDFEQVERDYVHIQSMRAFTEDEKRDMRDRRVDAFRRLGEMLPGMWW